MPGKYGSHADYMDWVKDDADSRQEAIDDALREAFSNFIGKRELEGAVFPSMTAFDPAKAIINRSLILKPLLATCSIAARAIERELAIKNLDTYSPRLNEDQAKVIAGYIKPFLPSYLEISALSRINRVAFIDKEIRKKKGHWKKKILENLNRFSSLPFHKRIFIAEGEQFELDAANSKVGNIKVEIDIKGIGARKDIHKRCNEIVNKAAKLKLAFPRSKFGAVVYYPFIEEHITIPNCLRSGNIDSVVFASEVKESVEDAIICRRKENL